jgi:creatinine amidohydrolase/Fe(II)-dependent formamide hydrolase-like protein
MPFIRQDFQNVRSDEYPVRLWTVAVFLFGAIPIMYKRKIGRLIIGDEFDTTTRIFHDGIPHYDGLFDQSRYFDNTMTRYFISKGWSITQFSVLRPLSEMLILKILAGRYPHLQAHQVSCHAAHIDDDRVFPCGKCEKCRRIIGMLVALEENPGHCGYTGEQIQYGLNMLGKKGIHQESAGQEHLLHLLKNAKKIILPENHKAHPEIMHLRFDPEKSPMDYIPIDLRRPLFNIFMQYADGAMKKKGRSWSRIDLEQESDLDKPFAFEAGVRISKGKPSASLSSKYLLGELTWPEAELCLDKVDIALLPVGAIEQHGPHLPLDTDAFDADYLARQVARACSDPKPLVLPLIPYGVSYHHDDFKGTFSINNQTLANLVYEIGMSAARNGIQKILIINGHGGNGPSLNFAAQMINRDAHIFVGVDSGETSDVDIYNYVETDNDVHAGEFETSTSLAIRPELVQMDKAVAAIPQFNSRYLNFTSKRGISWYAYTKKISKTGIMGDPTKANAEKGKKMWQIMVAHLVAFVEDLKRLSVEEIHQRRY